MTRIHKIAGFVLLAGAAFATSASAGGYGRGSANLDPLFDEGTSATTSFSVTNPSRGVDTRNGAAVSAAQGADYAETYMTFGATAATNIYGGVRCAGSYAQPYGANANYGFTKILLGSGTTTSTELNSSELGLTCAYGTEAGPGKVHFIGGLFYQSLDYTEVRGFGAASINMDNGGVGYRLGVGYTIPEFAIKASLIYRSEVDHRMEGVQMIGAAPFNIYADATTPQSLKLNLQSGIAPGWLAFGSVEWTGWSSIQSINVKCAQSYGPFCSAGGNSPGAPSVDAYFGDGWTVSAGIGHKFSDLFSGSFSVTWDQGVSRNYLGAKRSSYTDTWTLALGAAFTPNETSSFRAGLAYSILTAGSETGLGAGAPTIGYGTDYAVSAGIQGNFKF